MQNVEAPVTRAIVMICEKCGRKLDPSSEKNLSRELQQSLKSEVKALWGKGEVRTVVTTCMDVCPDGQIAIAINHLHHEHQHTEFFVADPASISQMTAEVLDKLKK